MFVFTHQCLVYVYIVCVSLCLHVYFGSSYPPEVFSIGLFGDVVFGVDVSLQGAKASPLRNVFFAEHACHLEIRSHTPLEYSIQ